MTGLLIIAHGSRNLASVEEIHRLVDSIRARNLEFDAIECAFLEMADPDIHTGVTGLVKRGITDIKILPYFLARGNHVVRDIPDIVEPLLSGFPALRIEILPHIGFSDHMAQLVVDHVRDKS